jgi:hypothetical protein
MAFKNLEMFISVSKIQYSNYHANHNSFNYSNSNTNSTLISYLFREFKKKNIKCTYNVTRDEKNHGKFILSTERFSYDIKDALAPICNGIIFDYHTLTPLCIPPIATISQYKSAAVNAHIVADNYDIFKLVDGSIISLYWCPYNRQWCMSSSHGLDIDNIRFNTKTYREIFDDIINQIQFKKTGDPLLDFNPHKEPPFFRCLDKAKSYTFSMTHPDLQPFQKNVGLTLICAVANKSWPEVVYDWEPEEFKNLIKTQNPIDNHKVFQYQERFTGHKNTDFSIEDIYYLSKTSVSSYLKKVELEHQLKIQGDDEELTNTLNSELYKNLTPFYGFILRAKLGCEDEVGDLNNVLITSLLMTKLKELLYNAKFSHLLKRKENIDRNKYIELYHFVNNSNVKQLYLQLFPNVYENWLKLANHMSEIGENIISKNALEDPDAEPNEYKKYIYKLAKHHFENDVIKDNQDQVINFLKSKELVIAYYYLVFPDKQEESTPTVETDSKISV